MRGSAAGVVVLVYELFERALKALQVEVQVEDLVDADRLGRGDRLRDGFDALDLLHCGARDRQHHDEGDLALRTRDLEVEALVLVAQDLNVAAFEAASADRAVVKAGAVADELDDAHDWPILRPPSWKRTATDGPRCRCIRRARRPPNAPFPRAAPCGRRGSAPGACPRLRART